MGENALEGSYAMNQISSITEFAEFEVAVRDAISRLQNGQNTEDDEFEFKSAWPSDDESWQKTAKNLAAHANAARGNPITWVYGVLEKDEPGKIVGIDQIPQEQFMQKLSRRYSEYHAPTPILHKVISYPDLGKAVIAIKFDTANAPFLTKRDDTWNDVPWRELSKARGIKRNELLKLLVRRLHTIEFEPIQAQLRIIQEGARVAGESRYTIALSASVYVAPSERREAVFPFHRVTASISFLASGASLNVKGFYISVGNGTITQAFGRDELDSHTLKVGKTEMIISGPGELVLKGHFQTLPIVFSKSEDVRIIINLSDARTNDSVKIPLDLTWRDQRDPSVLGMWMLRQ